MANLIFRPLQQTESDYKLLHQFMEKYLKSKLETLRWQYFDNPGGKMYIHIAVDKDRSPEEIAAMYAVYPVQFKRYQSLTTAVISLDTYTAEDYRKMGLFVKLADSLYDRCAGDNVSLVFGFPNHQSVHGFYNRLGWKSLDPVPLYIKPLRLGFFIKNISFLASSPVGKSLSNFKLVFNDHKPKQDHPHIRLINDFSDKQFDELWEAFSSNINYTVARNCQYLNWRFKQKPQKNNEKYKSMAYFEETRLKGFITYFIRSGPRGNIAYIMELIFFPKQFNVGRCLLDYAIKDIVSLGGDAILTLNLAHSPIN